MKNKILSALIALSFLTGTSLILSTPVGAADVIDDCAGNPDSPVCAGTGDELFGPDSIFIRIINILIFIVGILAVLMLIIGGMRYTLSAGDSNAVNGAKNTILYSVIGVVVAVAAYAIVNFVVVRLL